MPDDLFAPALRSLATGTWDTFGPMSFKRYLSDHGLGAAATAPAISVDAIERLPAALRESDTMVLRLGTARDGPGTQFMLVRCPGHLHDFFLTDGPEEGTEPWHYLPSVDLRSLLPYYVFPRPTERTLVNLAFASGLMGEVLGLDPPYPTAAPATGSSTYSFSFALHADYPQVVEHDNGQVEVDAVFVGRRGGVECLFILESKATEERTLAKHKLVYPVLALASAVPPSMPIIPVYMRVSAHEGLVRYRIVECSLADPRRGMVTLSSLVPMAEMLATLSLGITLE